VRGDNNLIQTLGLIAFFLQTPPKVVVYEVFASGSRAVAYGSSDHSDCVWDLQRGSAMWKVPPDLKPVGIDEQSQIVFINKGQGLFNASGYVVYPGFSEMSVYGRTKVIQTLSQVQLFDIRSGDLLFSVQANGTPDTPLISRKGLVLIRRGKECRIDIFDQRARRVRSRLLMWPDGRRVDGALGEESACIIDVSVWPCSANRNTRRCWMRSLAGSGS